MTSEEAQVKIIAIIKELEGTREADGILISATLNTLVGVLTGYSFMKQPWMDMIQDFNRKAIELYTGQDLS